MEKNAKLFWRCFGAILALAEIAMYVLLIRKPFTWLMIRFIFMAVNVVIIAHLVQVKLRAEKHNAEIKALERP